MSFLALQGPISERLEHRRHRAPAGVEIFSLPDGEDLSRGAGARCASSVSYNMSAANDPSNVLQHTASALPIDGANSRGNGCVATVILQSRVCCGIRIVGGVPSCGKSPETTHRGYHRVQAILCSLVFEHTVYRSTTLRIAEWRVTKISLVSL